MKTIKEKIDEGAAREDSKQCEDCPENTICRCEPIGKCQQGINIKNMGYKKN